MSHFDSVVAIRYSAGRALARFRVRYFFDFSFVHINKTGGSSIEKALGLPFQHLTALELRSLIGAERWARRFSFGFVRNPWDKVVSHYHYRVRTNQTDLGSVPIPFDDWVMRAYGERDPRYHDQPKMFQPQHEWLEDLDGTRLVDYVGRFERLHEDFTTVCDRIGVEATLPHLKRSAHPDYRDIYREDSREVVARVFGGDLERYGYTFDG